MFLALISVSGIGPKLAQGILSGVTPTEFQNAIVEENVRSLTALRGIGQKTAQRLIVELKDRFDAPQHTEPTNCCIGDGKLYVTYSGTGQLIAFDCEWEALPLYPDRA